MPINPVACMSRSQDISTTKTVIDPKAHTVKWLLKIANPGNANGILNIDPAEVEDVLLVLGNERED